MKRELLIKQIKIFVLLAVTIKTIIPTKILALQLDYVPLEKDAFSGSGFETSIGSGPDQLGTFLFQAFQFGLAIAAALAVVMIVWGGVEIMFSESFMKKSDGKARIWGAVWGLVLALISWLILYTINPTILNWGAFTSSNKANTGQLPSNDASGNSNQIPNTVPPSNSSNYRYTFSDEGLMTENKADGSRIIHNTNGTITNIDKNGQVSQSVDLSGTAYNNDGSVTKKDINGQTTTYSKDGTITIVKPDGTKGVAKRDGTMSIIDSTGKVIRTETNLDPEVNPAVPIK